MIFFTSDFHFGHEKILTLGAGRPFASVDAMQVHIMGNLNARIGNGDTLYVLGDWCCGLGKRDKIDYVRETVMNLGYGIKIHWILGNHDPSFRSGRPSKLVTEGVLASVSDMQTIRVGRDREIVMCHYPLEDWGFEEAGTIMLHGHRHGAGVRHATRRRLDVGVDGHDYAPWSLDEVMDEMRRTPWKAVSHHA